MGGRGAKGMAGWVGEGRGGVEWGSFKMLCLGVGWEGVVRVISKEYNVFVHQFFYFSIAVF